MVAYRPEIDALRAISVLAVILFHSGLGFASGGFVGVDVFFVISGFLITGIVSRQVQEGSFSFTTFYKRRIARLLPSLIITLLIVVIFGFFAFDLASFDNLGREVFFASLGAANILFAQGDNYFLNDDSLRPLLHLWSLGVEEQFYLFWPALLVGLSRFKFRFFIFVVIGLFLTSFLLAVNTVVEEPVKAYFYPQYRAFELFAGSIAALSLNTKPVKAIVSGKVLVECALIVSLVAMLLPVFFYSHETTFPGVATLLPVSAVMFFLIFSAGSKTANFLKQGWLVTIGLISYPLYLLHQPILSTIDFFELTDSELLKALMVFAIAVPLSWLIYMLVEKPIRRQARKSGSTSTLSSMFLVLLLLGTAGIGFFVAKSNGVESRFKWLNPFAASVIEHSRTTFHTHFKRGADIGSDAPQKILFFGDSVLQQYVWPLSQFLGYERSQIDMVTRGGCVLLKDVDYTDSFSDISCGDLRRDLYTINKRYDYVVFSQSWDSYTDEMQDFKGDFDINMWSPHIVKTIKHFSQFTDRVIIIGAHLKIGGTKQISPSVFLDSKQYLNAIDRLTVLNKSDLMAFRSYFDSLNEFGSVSIIHPGEIWRRADGEFNLHDETWAFFRDKRHVSQASTPYLLMRLSRLLATLPDHGKNTD